MPQTRYIDVYDSQGKLIAQEPYTVPDSDLVQEALRQHFNDIHVTALAWYTDWDSVTLQQKDRIIKELLGYVLWKEGWLTPEED